MPILRLPDIFGHVIFCDDIRQEDGTGKAFYIGVYLAGMFVHSGFPVTLPSFAIAVSVSQRKKIFNPKVGLRIFLPGDPDTEASIQAEVDETVGGTIVSHIQQVKEATHPDARAPSEEEYPTMKAALKFAPIVMRQPGRINVQAVIGDNVVRLGGLPISPAFQPSNEPPE